MELVINVFLLILGLYLAIGLVFGLYFFAAGAQKIDPAIKESKWTVRLLLLPGAIAMWAVLFPKLLKAGK